MKEVFWCYLVGFEFELEILVVTETLTQVNEVVYEMHVDKLKGQMNIWYGSVSAV